MATVKLPNNFIMKMPYKSMKTLVWLNIHYQPVIYYAWLHENIFLHTEYIRHIHSHMELTDIYVANMGIYKFHDSLSI